MFDGSGTCLLAASMCGIEPVWASEIEKFPVQVTTKRFPNVKHLGDITKINGAEIEPVDIITFGSPCQDLSVAGKRAGLDGTKSSLFMEAIRIVKEMRNVTNNEYPKYIMWENVPGAFSSNKGLDFRTVLEEITETEIPMPDGGKWATSGMVELPDRQVAWRVLDAQYWGVPQRRKRIFLVADFTGKRAGEVLFKPESLYRNFEEGRETWEGVASDFERRIGASGTDYLTGWDNQEKRVFTDRGVSPTIAGSDGGGGRTGVGYLFETGESVQSVIPIHDKVTRHSGAGDTRNNDDSANGLEIGKDGDPCPTLDTNGRHAVAVNGFGETGIGYWQNGIQTLRAEGENRPSRPSNVVVYPENTVGSLIARADGSPCVDRGQPFVVTAGFMAGQGAKAGGIGYQEEVSPTLKSVLSGGNTVPSIVTYPDVAGTLCASGAGLNRPAGQCNEIDLCIVQTNDIAYGFCPDNSITAGGVTCEQEKTATLSTTKRMGAVLASGKPATGTLMANCSTKLWLGNQEAFSGDYSIIQNKQVRRLTPTECARLQGFPDWWCADVEHSDTAEYKMWGNGMALPCVLYIMQNIASNYKESTTTYSMSEQ